MSLSAKEKIQKAYIGLVLEKGFDKTSVAAIIKEAKIHRSTFYSHYLDKYDLVDSLQSQVLFEMQQCFTNEAGFVHIEDDEPKIYRLHYIELLSYIKSQKDLIQAVMAGEFRVDFMMRFQNEMNDLFLESYNHHNIRIPHTDAVLNQYYDDIFTAAVFRIFQTWMARDFQDDIELIADIVMRLDKIYE